MRQQLPAFAALIVGVEDEPAIIGALEKHHPCRRRPVCTNGGQRHRVRLVRLRLGGREATKDPQLASLDDHDFADLPPTVIVTAECDPLSSDGEVYRDRIVAAEGRAWWREEPGLVHGFLRARHRGRREREAFARLVAAITKLGQGENPY